MRIRMRDVAGRLSRRWRAFRVLMAFGLQANRRQWAVLLAAAVLTPVGDLAVTYALKLLTDSVLRQSLNGVLVAAVVAASAWALVLFSALSYLRLAVQIEERASLAIDRRLMAVTAGIPGLEHHERPDYADKVALVRSQRHLLGEMTHAVGMNVRTWVSLVGSAVLLVRLHPLLLVLPLFGLGSFFAGRKANAIQRRVDEANAERGRRRRHLLTLATSAASAKELRVFGLADELVARHDVVAGEMRREAIHGAWQRGALEVGGSLCFALGYVGSIALVLVRAVQGQATAGDVVLVVGLAAQLNVAAAWVVDWGSYLGRAITAADRYVWLTEYAERARPAPANAVPPPPLLSKGIDLEHVSFRYPGTAAPVLSDVSLHLPAGSVVALVGENGAGKTTLVKLLARLYEPDEGGIAVDGIDLRRVRVEEWRSRIAAGFQDFSRFELRVGETVGVGDLPRRNDVVVVEGALARAGGGDVIATLPAGLETQLGRSWGGGIDLSGGQWQKLALARALMRWEPPGRPLLTIFDEPTAALDAPTEHALFERFAAAARRGWGTRGGERKRGRTRGGERRDRGGQGGEAKRGQRGGSITVLVSHRFSTVRMADLIVVLDRGRVLEIGSHDELMRRNGLYAELFTLQASAYR
jgi:ABC-type multidrug transport system fused ATPase/permease subunit